jgi:polysaccharide biosynthesis/export protein
MMRIGQILVLMGVAGVLAVGGCTPRQESDPEAEKVFHHADSFSVAVREYIVEPPDEIIVHAPAIAQLDKQQRKVAPNGKISFNLVGDLDVAGKTPSEINTLLRETFSKFYQAPDIKVEIIDNSKFYYIFGQGVNDPGAKVFTGRDTIVAAIADAGFSDRGWPQQVYLSRPNEKTGKSTRVIVDFTKIFEHADMTQNYLIEKGDVINVPMSPLSSWNFQMTKIVGPITGAGSAVSSGSAVVHPGGTGTVK